MKTIKTIILTIIALAFSFSVKAQVVTGSNLTIGENNTLLQTGTTFHSNAIGKNNYLEGVSSLTVGENDTILNPGGASVALGSCNKVTESASFAIGSNVKVLGLRCVGIGHLVKVTGPSGSMAIGSGLLGSSFQPNLFLENNYNESLMIGFHSTKPTFTVTPSPNDYPDGNLLFDRTGKIAIGDVPMPDIAAKLHIRSDMEEDAGIILEPKDPENSSTFIRMRDEGHGIEVTNTGTMIVKSMDDSYIRPLILKGSVGINIPDNYIDDLEQQPIYSLCVKGGIVAEKVAIKECSTWWPDYVFSTDYQLMSLDHLREYISENRHLPDVPSESQVMEEGFELGEMQSILLKKIEELTLYTLELQEQMKAMQVEIDELKNK